MSPCEKYDCSYPFDCLRYYTKPLGNGITDNGEYICKSCMIYDCHNCNHYDYKIKACKLEGGVTK